MRLSGDCWSGNHLVDRVLDSPAGSFLHGATWGGHPVVMAASVANLTAMQDEKVVENVARNESWTGGAPP